MHGRLKVKTTEEQKRLAKIEKEKEMKIFSDLMNNVIKSRKTNIKNVETLNLIAECLAKSPEWNLFWNYRREILIELNFEEELMNKELILTKSCLRENPKAYAVWHHRTWVMNNHPSPDWQSELKLCNLALKEDERNFHCWDYRRFIVKKGGISTEDEFEYTVNQIYDNISNYSSWHYRCGFLNSKLTESQLKDELDLINNSVFSDPHDQSPWFYLRWLLLYNKKRAFFREMYINKALKEIIFIISEPVLPQFFANTFVKIINKTESGEETVVISDKESIENKISSVLQNSNLSSVWKLDLRDEDADFTQDLRIVISYCCVNKKSCCDNDSDTCTWTCELPSTNFESLIRTDTDINRILCDSVSEEMSLDIIEEELRTIRELHSIETDNKWVLLTIISMLRILSPIDSLGEVLDKLHQLETIDDSRTNFYRDAASKFQIECELIQLYNSHTRDVILPSRNLTLIDHLDWMVLMTKIDLSNNQLTQLPAEFQYLVCLTHLDLSNNRITSLANLRGLPSLQQLDVHNNAITIFPIDTDSALYCPSLLNFNIKGNTVSQLPNLTDLLSNHPSNKKHSGSIAVLYDRILL